MMILATSDVHSPENLQMYLDLIERVPTDPQIVLFVGDMVDKNRVPAFKPVYDATRRKLPSAKIVSVFGNEEYRGFERLYEQMYSDVIWLNDSYVRLLNGDICIVGTRGALDRPTPWQARNIPAIEKYYRDLPNLIERMALELRQSGCKKVILASHYGVTYLNLVGEKKETYPFLASTRFERVIRRELVDVVIHGHAHMGRLEVVNIRGVPVYNVSLPARRKLVEIEL